MDLSVKAPPRPLLLLMGGSGTGNKALKDRTLCVENVRNDHGRGVINNMSQKLASSRNKPGAMLAAEIGAARCRTAGRRLFGCV